MFDLISFPLVILSLALLTWQLSDMTWESWKIGEHGWSLFAPPLYPIKTIYLIGVFLLLLQAVAFFCRKLRSFRKQDPAEEGDL